MNRSALFLALCLPLLLVLPACNEEPESPAPSAPEVDGSATPQDLVANLKAAGDAEDVGALMRQIAPRDRALMTSMVAVAVKMMPAMMKGMAGMMTGMAEQMTEAMTGEPLTAEQQAKVDEAKARFAVFDEVEKDIDALFEQYGLDDSVAMGGLAALEGSVDARAAAADGIDEQLGDIDHAAFVSEAMALLDRLDDGSGENGKPEMTFTVDPSSLKVDGDRATLMVKDKPAVLKKIDGRWYLSLRDSEF